MFYNVAVALRGMSEYFDAADERDGSRVKIRT